VRLRAFTDPIVAYVDGRSRRMTPELTEEYIPIVEARIALNARFRADLPGMIDEQQKFVDQNAVRINAAREAVYAVAHAERQWLDSIGSMSGMIHLAYTTVSPGLWLNHRGCHMDDTPEFRRLELLETRAAGPNSPETLAIRELGRLQTMLDDERKLEGQFLGRLHDLKANLEWWAQQLAALEVAV
jgi:hypothetical protein